MSRRSVQRHLASDSRRRYHISQLADDMIGKQFAQIIFYKRHGCSQKCHKDSDIQKCFGPAKHESKHKLPFFVVNVPDRHSCLPWTADSICNPSIQRRDCTVDRYTDENKPGRRISVQIQIAYQKLPLPILS